MKKAIVIGVILLFLGVGFQPALAVSDVDKDCLECQPVSRVDNFRVKLLFIRLEVVINVILSKFAHIPEIVTICKEILEILNDGIKDITLMLKTNLSPSKREYWLKELETYKRLKTRISDNLSYNRQMLKRDQQNIKKAYTTPIKQPKSDSYW